MKYFYCCGSGVHASIIAASAHLGILKDQKISGSELLSLPFFNLPTAQISGKPFFLGKDAGGNEVYTLPVGKEKKICLKIIKGFCNLFGIPRDEIVLIDCEKYVSPLMAKVNKFRSLPGMNILCRNLILVLLKNKYPQLVKQGREARNTGSEQQFGKA